MADIYLSVTTIILLITNKISFLIIFIIIILCILYVLGIVKILFQQNKSKNYKFFIKDGKWNTIYNNNNKIPN